MRTTLANVTPFLTVADVPVVLGTYATVAPLSRSEKSDAMSQLSEKHAGNIPAAIIDRVKNATRTAFAWLAVTKDDTDVSDTSLADLLADTTLDDTHRGVFVHGVGSDLPTSIVLSGEDFISGGHMIVPLRSVTVATEGRKKQANGTWKGTNVWTDRTHAEASVPVSTVAGRVFTLAVRISPRPTGLKVTARLS